MVIEEVVAAPDRSIQETSGELMDSRQALGVVMMMLVAVWTPSILLSLGAQAISGPINSIVTNVPGPQFPLYLQGAKLEAIYPQVPLLGGLGVGIALMSYNGRVCWGFNADPDIVADIAVFTQHVSESMERVAEAAGVEIEGELAEERSGEREKAQQARARASQGPASIP